MSRSDLTLQALSAEPGFWWHVRFYAASLTLHALLMLCAAYVMSNFRGGTGGAGIGDTTGVGMYFGADAGPGDGLEAGGDSPGEPEVDTTLPDSPTKESGVPTVSMRPPVPLDLPQADAVPQPNETAAGFSSARSSAGALAGVRSQPGGGVLGNGGRGGSGGGSGAGQGTGTGVGGGGGGTGPKGTTFFGARAAGRRLVYLLDCSGSMEAYGALDFAKAELLRSLAQLESVQRFQVIFYSEQAQALALDGDRTLQLYTATDVNRRKTERFIGAIRPQTSTNHLVALNAALKLDPDVIFFLTDADTALMRGEIDEITRANGGRAEIHCIEFGRRDKNLDIGSFLEQLARANGGSYQYRDITEFK